MITYAVSGRVPAGITPSLLTRIAAACAGARGLPRRPAVIGLRFVAPAEMQRLNRTFRGKNRATDVLSFSAREGEPLPAVRGADPIELGDLVVCPSVARAEARRRCIDPAEELVRLVAHGTLHLAGMDHATLPEEEQMFAAQERIVEAVCTRR